MKPAADLGDAVEGMEPGNVDSSDKEAIKDYLDGLNTRLEDENLTDGEKDVIQDLIDDAQDLLDKIDEAGAGRLIPGTSNRHRILRRTMRNRKTRKSWKPPRMISSKLWKITTAITQRMRRHSLKKRLNRSRTPWKPSSV